MNSSSIAQSSPVARTRFDWFAISAFAVVWLELIARLRLEWSVNPQYGYGWVVPLLAAYIFWRHSETAPAPRRPAFRFLPIVVIIGGALVLPPIRLIEEANPDWRLMSWAMALAVAGITFAAVLLAGGWPWARHFAFPILFFLVAVPWPTQFEQAIIQGLMRADTAINVEVLNIIGIPAVQLGNVIEIGTGYVGIDEACTGVRSLQATFMVSLFLGELYEFGVLRRVILIIAGAAIAFFCNLVRTFLLVWIGADKGAAAIKKWHDPAGLSILLVCLAALWLLSIWMRSKTTTPGPPAAHARSGFRIPRLLFVVLLASVVVAEGGTAWWYHRSKAARLPAWNVQWPTQAEQYQKVPVAESAQELLRYNEGGGAMWKSTDQHQWGMYFFRWFPGQTAGLFIKNHRPDICLPASGMTQTSGARPKLFEINGVPMPVRAYTFDDRGVPLHVYYCYWDGSVPNPNSINSENWTAGGRLQSVREGKRDVGTQMLEIVAWGYEDDAAAEAAVRGQLQKIITAG